MSEESIFVAALEKLTPAERTAYLEGACAGDPELRRRVEALLRAHEQSGDLLDPPIPGPGPSTLHAVGSASGPGGNPPPTRPIAEGPGTRIGPYRILEPIGEGGMGVVFLAEQEAPVRRSVALKVIKPGMDTALVVARFEAERQALALMDHNHIAKVFDAGTTDSGRPFFVMELVSGVPITEYCDRNRLTPKERLELFVAVCRAIQHAHQKGIIHRDIKPSNVMVALHDGNAVPKVIDFGVAKAIDRRLTERTLFTQLGAIVGTPEYMSPEQAEMSGWDIDTRSDIYSLGVLLYELLTGSTPLEGRRLRTAAFAEVLRRFREEEPPKPSTRLLTTEETASIAAWRGTEPGKLAKLMRGELDWIVMKALEKDRARRYETASGLARDIERYLHDEPVEAGPPTAAYRLRKFARRHRGALGTATAFAGLLILAVVVSTWQAIRATWAETKARQDRNAAVAARQAEAEARRRAEEAEQGSRIEAEKAMAINRFLTEDLLSQAEPEHNAVDSKVTLLEVLDRSAEKVGERFRDQPEVEAAVRRTIAGAYHGLGVFDRSARHWRTVAELEQRRSGPNSVESWMVLAHVGHLQDHLGQYNEAMEVLLRARDALVRLRGPDHPDTLDVTAYLAAARRSAGRIPEAIPLLEEELRLRRTKQGPDAPATLTAMSNLALTYHDAGRTSEAIPLLEEVLRLDKTVRGSEHPATLSTMNNLALAYQRAGRVAEAIPLLEATLRLRKIRLGPDHPSILTSTNNLAGAYKVSGRLDEALPLFEQTLGLMRTKLGPDHPNTLVAMNNLALTYRDSGRLDKALPLFEEVFGLMKAKLGVDHPNTLTAMFNLALVHQSARRLDKALPLFEEVFGLMKAKLGVDHPYTLIAMSTLALTYRETGRLDQAISLYEELMRLTKAKQGPDHPETLLSMNNLVRAELDARRWAAAEAVARECLDVRARKLPDDWLRFHTMSQLGAALAGQEKYTEAEPFLVGGYEGLKVRESRIPAPSRGQLGVAAARIIPFYEAWGKRDQAAAWRARLNRPADAAMPKP